MPLSGADSSVVTIGMLRTEATSRRQLSLIISGDSRNRLYLDELETIPLEDVIQQMRRDISMDLAGPTRIAIQFTYPDQSKARMATLALARATADALQQRNQPGQGDKKGPVLSVVDAAILPTQALMPAVWLTAAIGLVAGLLLAVLWRAIVRRPIGRTGIAWGVAGALAGIAAALVTPLVSKSIPDGTLPFLYRSHATLFAEGEDARYLSNLLARLSSRMSLASIIVDPRLNLYPDRMKGHELEDVAETMRQDVVITSRSAAGGRWIDISFTYLDRLKCQQTVQAFMSRLDEDYSATAQNANTAPDRLRNWGSIDSSGMSPVDIEAVGPNRAAAVLLGLAAGLILAALIAVIRHRSKPSTRKQWQECPRYDSDSTAAFLAGWQSGSRLPVRRPEPSRCLSLRRDIHRMLWCLSITRIRDVPPC